MLINIHNSNSSVREKRNIYIFNLNMTFSSLARVLLRNILVFEASELQMLVGRNKCRIKLRQSSDIKKIIAVNQQPVM